MLSSIVQYDGANSGFPGMRELSLAQTIGQVGQKHNYLMGPTYLLWGQF